MIMLQREDKTFCFRLHLCSLYSQLVLSLTKYLAVLWLLYVEYVCISHRGSFKENFCAVNDRCNMRKLFKGFWIKKLKLVFPRPVIKLVNSLPKIGTHVEMIPETLLTDTLNLNARSSRDNPCLRRAKTNSNSFSQFRALFLPGFF